MKFWSPKPGDIFKRYGAFRGDSCREAADLMGYEVIQEPAVTLPKWVRPEMALPAEDTPVLVIASGQPVHETILDHAVLLAKCYPDEGWVLEEYPDYEQAEIHFWAPIPELPEEARV